MEKVRIGIYGGGGFGREVAWLVEETHWPERRYEFVGFIDDDRRLVQKINGYPVFTLAHVAKTFPDTRIVLAVGDPNIRQQLAKKVSEAHLIFETLIHPNVVRSSSVNLGIGSIVCAGCVLTTNIVLGQHVIVIYGSSIGHDVSIGDFSTVW